MSKVKAASRYISPGNHANRGIEILLALKIRSSKPSHVNPMDTPIVASHHDQVINVSLLAKGNPQLASILNRKLLEILTDPTLITNEDTSVMGITAHFLLLPIRFPHKRIAG